MNKIEYRWLLKISLTTKILDFSQNMSCILGIAFLFSETYHWQTQRRSTTKTTHHWLTCVIENICFLVLHFFGFFQKPVPWSILLLCWRSDCLPLPIMQLHILLGGNSRATWSLCHPRMSAIQATRVLPPLQFKFSAAAVFVKPPPGGPQTPWPAPRGSHNRTILGALHQN